MTRGAEAKVGVPASTQTRSRLHASRLVTLLLFSLKPGFASKSLTEEGAVLLLVAVDEGHALTAIASPCLCELPS